MSAGGFKLELANTQTDRQTDRPTRFKSAKLKGGGNGCGGSGGGNGGATARLRHDNEEQQRALQALALLRQANQIDFLALSLADLFDPLQPCLLVLPASVLPVESRCSDAQSHSHSPTQTLANNIKSANRGGQQPG